MKAVATAADGLCDQRHAHDDGTAALKGGVRGFQLSGVEEGTLTRKRDAEHRRGNGEGRTPPPDRA